MRQICFSWTTELVRVIIGVVGRITEMAKRVDTNGASEITNYKPESLANMRWRGQGPPYYAIGNGTRKKIVYDVQELENWMRKHRVEPEAVSA
jgi:hypothetical protein